MSRPSHPPAAHVPPAHTGEHYANELEQEQRITPEPACQPPRDAASDDTKVWEQSAAYILDTHSVADAFVKNAGLGFAIPYLHNGQPHDYVPDFIVRLNIETPVHLIIETKGFDELADVKAAAAERWVAAVNADGQFGTWKYAMVRSVPDVRKRLDEVLAGATAEHI